MLKNVVFDLDGTLWQTTDSYVYAYHKLCDFYGLKEKVSDEVVKTYLGVRLDILLNELFPTVTDKTALAYRALGFSVEYLAQHPKDCCFQGVQELLKTAVCRKLLFPTASKQSAAIHSLVAPISQRSSFLLTSKQFPKRCSWVAPSSAELLALKTNLLFPQV